MGGYKSKFRQEWPHEEDPSPCEMLEANIRTAVTVDACYTAHPNVREDPVRSRGGECYEA